MKCAKLRLQERTKAKSNKENYDEPRRICQKRLVNPQYEEDPRWIDAYERYYCNDFDNYDVSQTNDSGRIHHDRDDLCLTVQNLQFQGNVEQSRRPRTSFKYKTLPDSQKHRMFVKQAVEDTCHNDSACYSVLSNYGDDYMKYLSNNDTSRTSSSKSSIVLYCLNNKLKENKSIQVDLRTAERRKTKFEKGKKVKKADIKTNITEDLKLNKDDNDEDTKITFHKTGKRKSLTISRTASPATIQVIRVDVVCNYSSSPTISDYDGSRKESSICTEQEVKENQVTKFMKSHFTNKYMLANTVKTLDENVSGSKVTLMCKTFKLSDRSKQLLDRKQKCDINEKIDKNKLQN